MRALTIDYARRELRERNLPEPVLQDPDEVLLRVLEVGICGTDRDLAAFQFGRGPAGDDFLVPGHEAVCEVLAIGPAVAGLEPGDIVVPAVRRGCVPACLMCARNRRDLCVSGNYSERGILGAHGYFTELAVDRVTDLVRIPHELSHIAVLVEPLSVVEKAVALAQRLHAGEPRRALVLGAGTVGLLASMVLRLRGFDVDIVSTEASDSPRAKLAELAGARYLREPDGQSDIVIEAAGSPVGAAIGLQSLSPLGVLVVLGAREMPGPVPLLDLIIGNRIVAGSVNASPDAFSHAVLDLALLPRRVVEQMIERAAYGEFIQTLKGPPSKAPKIVHVMR
jgi:threonine dehydrogenase-like Zn-dependent dehydrogenase